MKDCHRFELILDGQNFVQTYLDLIQSAQKHIVLHTYIFKYDHFGHQVLDLLIEKAKNKVWVNLLIDYFGSFELDHKTFLSLNSIPHFEIKFFNVFRFPRYVFSGRRLHHKTLIIDEKTAIIGGINVLDSYDEGFPHEPRLDFALEIQGEVVHDINQYCLAVSNRKRRRKITKRSRKSLREYEQLGIKLLINDWLKNRKQITFSYISAIKHAQKEILLIHGYFFPMQKMIRILCRKAKSGVEVKLLLPQHSDWRSWLWASEFLYAKLIKAGVRVFLWKKSVLHGKLALVDGSVLNLGSHNLNYTSSFGNLEMNIELSQVDQKLPKLNSTIEKLFAESECYLVFSQGTWLGKGLRWIRNFLAYYLLKAVAGFFKGLIIRAKKL